MILEAGRLDFDEMKFGCDLIEYNLITEFVVIQYGMRVWIVEQLESFK